MSVKTPFPQNSKLEPVKPLYLIAYVLNTGFGINFYLRSWKNMKSVLKKMENYFQYINIKTNDSVLK